jgi:hypothetical protein
VTRLLQFVVALGRLPTADQVGRLLEQCPDATIEVHPPSGEAWVAFDREAPTLVDAIVTGVHDLHRAGMSPVQVHDDDDLVTVGLVAQRIGREEATVRRWAAGEGEPGDFPAPIVDHPRRPCYLWSEVAPWLRVHFGIEQPDVGPTLRAVNLALELHSLAPAVDRMAAIRSLLSG